MIPASEVAQIAFARLYAVIVLAGCATSFLRFRRLDRVGRWCAGWVWASAVAILLITFAARLSVNSTSVAKGWYVLSAGLAIAMLAAAVPQQQLRRRTFVLAGLTATGLGLVTLLDERHGEIANMTSALHAVALVLAGAGMVVLRVQRARARLLADPTFLIGGALLLGGVTSGFLGIFGALAASAPGVRAHGQFLRTFTDAMAVVAHGAMLRALLPSRGDARSLRRGVSR